MHGTTGSGNVVSNPQSRPSKRRTGFRYRSRHNPLHAFRSSSHVSHASRGLQAPMSITDEKESQAENVPTDGDSHGSGLTGAHHGNAMMQVVAWLQGERRRRALRKTLSRKTNGQQGFTKAQHEESAPLDLTDGSPVEDASEDSGDSDALNRLDQILAPKTDPGKLARRGVRRPGSVKRSSGRSPHHQFRRPKLRQPSPPDTDDAEPEWLVPESDVVLDNTKMLRSNHAIRYSSRNLANLGKELGTDSKESLQFKEEVMRLAHTLGLKGWKRVPIERGRDIGLERLSGALTNSVYVVAPPRLLESQGSNKSDSVSPPTPRQPSP